MGESIFSDTTASTESWNIAQSWFQKCRSSHPKCKHGVGFENTKKLPTRLLEISADQGSTVCLRNAANLPPDTEYTTLSHCWGRLNVLLIFTPYKAICTDILQFAYYVRNISNFHLDIRQWGNASEWHRIIYTLPKFPRCDLCLTTVRIQLYLDRFNVYGSARSIFS